MVDAPSPHQSDRRGHHPCMVIIHGDAGKTDAGTVSWIQYSESKVSYHYLIGRDGETYQFVPEDRRAWHAGTAEWGGKTDINSISIGVSFANDGTEPYKPVQYKVGGKLVAEICERHKIPCHLIRGHYEVSPGRKTDPWDHFDWGEFYRWFGLYSGGKA